MKKEKQNKDDMLRVGIISSTHGIRGEVKVYPTTDDKNRFLELKKVYVETGSELFDLEIERIRFFKQMVIVKFKGYDNINEVEKYKGMDLLITRKDAVPLAENEYFICDVVGSEVLAERTNGDFLKIGTVADIMTSAANDVYVVRLTEEINEFPAEVRGGRQIEDGTELLLPSIPECILDVNVTAKQVKVRLMKGLL